MTACLGNYLPSIAFVMECLRATAIVAKISIFFLLNQCNSTARDRRSCPRPCKLRRLISYSCWIPITYMFRKTLSFLKVKTPLLTQESLHIVVVWLTQNISVYKTLVLLFVCLSLSDPWLVHTSLWYYLEAWVPIYHVHFAVIFKWKCHG